jgi:hypothetical protein
MMLTAAIVAAISFFFLVLKSLALLPLLSPGSPVGRATDQAIRSGLA